MDRISRRLKGVRIHNRDAIEVIRRYDSPDTLFYVDPPYVHSTRSQSVAYEVELQDSYHEQLAEALHGVDGKVALSGYESDLYGSLYGDWECYRDKRRMLNIGYSNPVHREEVLWVNY